VLLEVGTSNLRHHHASMSTCKANPFTSADPFFDASGSMGTSTRPIENTDAA
jgi:hypothetical protein